MSQPAKLLDDLPPIGADDVIKLLSASQEAQKSILVGGQALNIWAQRYGIQREKAVLLSADVDFVGSAPAATRAGIQWGANINLPRNDDHTPNTALITLDFAGGKREIDFLIGVLGVDNDELNRMAVTLKFNAESEIRIMHPLHCMISQITNAYGKELNRRADPKLGQWIAERAKVSVIVAAKNVCEYLEQGHLNPAKRISAKVADFAIKPAAIEAFMQDNIDVMDAIPKEHPNWKDSFEETVFSPLMKRVGRVRTHRQAHARKI